MLASVAAPVGSGSADALTGTGVARSSALVKPDQVNETGTAEALSWASVKPAQVKLTG
jgi:hypothetical protein